MNEKQCMETFILDIDRIASGESIPFSAYEHCEAEYQELLLVAQLLAKTDYSEESQSGAVRVWAKIQKKGQLEDDDLDLVAGGIHLNILNGEADKKR